MAISNINATNLPSPVKPAATTSAAAQVNRERLDENRQPAAVVTLSAQARKLSMEENTSTQTETRTMDTRINQTQSLVQSNKAATDKVETGAKEAAAAPSERAEENRERRRINTYA